MTSPRIQDERDLRTVAVIGTGSIGSRHLAVLGRMQGVRAVALPKRAGRASELAETGLTTAKTLEDAVGMGATHAVIASATQLHLDDALAAMQCGMDVLIEKPMAANAREGAEMVSYAAGHQRNLFVGCVLRFSESLKVFQEWLGLIGHLHSVRIECQSYLPDWRPGRPYRETYSARPDVGGVLRDLIHEIDYAVWLYGWPRAVQARLRNLGRLQIDSEEQAELLWESPGGALVSISVDYLSRPGRRRMRACGEHGTLEWDAIASEVALSVPGESDKRFKSTQGRDDRFRAQAQAFLQVATGARDPRLATGEEGAKALAICDAARLASEARREEVIAYL